MEGVKEKPQINTPIAPPQKAMPLKLTENVQIKGIIPDGGFKGATNHIRNNVEDILKKSPTKMKNLDSSYDVRKKDLTFEEKIIDKTLQNEVIRNVFPVSADMYTDARTDFSRARLNKNATILENMNSLDSKTQETLKKYGVKSNERGVYYNSDSDASKKFGKSNELKRAFDKNYQDIKKGNFKDDNINFDAKITDVIFNKDKFDRHSSIQHAKLYDAYIDEQGRKHVKIGDDYDFKKRADTLKNIPNNHGYSLQEKGALENFFTVMDVIIEDEEEKEKLLNKLMKRMQR